MKNFRKILLFAIILLGFSGMFFGCGDIYSNLKIQTDLSDNKIELVCSESDESAVSKSFNVSVLGATGDISTSIKYYLENSGLVSVSLSHSESSPNTTVKLTALDYGETDLILRTEGGNKTTKVHITVTLAVENITNNANYKPFAVIGKTTKINTAKCIEFLPSRTTQKDVYYEKIGGYNDVEVLQDGNIVVGDDAQNGTLEVRAISKYNPSVYTNFSVKILRGVDDIIVTENETQIEQNQTLKFSNNMTAESVKILSIKPYPEDENDYTFEYKIVGNETETTSDIFGCEEMEEETIVLTAIRTGKARLKLVAKLDGYDYESEAKYISLNSIETPSTVSVISSQTSENLTVYDTYQNGLGEVIRVYVGGANADDRRFVISANESDADKIKIYTGNRDSSGRLVSAKFYDGYINDFDVFSNGTTLYLIASDEVASSSTITLSFIAYGSLNLNGDIVKTDVNIELKHGVTRLITNKNQFIDDMIFVPVSQNGEKFEITISTEVGEWTDEIKTEFSSDGLLFETTSISYDYAVVSEDELTRDYIFSVTGVKDGVYYINFFTKNGNHTDIVVRVFTKVTDMTLTTATIDENSDIGELSYKTNANNLQTLNEITIKYRGNVKLNINAYNNNNLQKCTYKNVEYDYNNNYIRIDSSGNILGYAVTDDYVKYPDGIPVSVVVVVYDDEAISGSKTFEFNFKIKVYVAIQSVSINQTNAIIYTKSSLSSFVGEDGLTDKQRYGEFEFVLKVNPEKTVITANNLSIKWSGQEIGDPEAFKYVYDFDYEANIYKIKVWSEYIANLINADDTSIERNVRFTVTIIQYQRTIVKTGNIIIKQASKISDIYNIKKVQDGEISPVTTQNGSLYLYFDSRNMSSTNVTQFTLTAQTNPTEVLNDKLVVLMKNDGEYEDVLTIENNVVIVNKAGVAWLYLCSQDSCYSSDIKDPDSYATRVMIYVKVADGLSKSTSLDISSAQDLADINNNVESLQKFYSITKSFSIPYKNWTPIGIIDGRVYDFEGNIEGLISDDYGQSTNAIITGFNINNAVVASNNIAYAGLFARLGANAIIQNIELHVASVNINQTSSDVLTTYFGAIAGYSNAVIQNVTVKFINGGKNVETDENIIDYSNYLYAGGIVGNNSGSIKFSTVSGYLNVLKNLISTSIYNIGGIAGLNSGTIDSKTSFFNKTDFDDSYTSSMNIVVKEAGRTDLIVSTGGVAGKNTGRISKASFDGKINAKDNVGGIVGYDNGGTISETFSSGFVSGNISVGGLVGKANDENDAGATSITNSSVIVFDMEEIEAPSIIGSHKVGGLVGSFEGSKTSQETKYSTIENSYIRSYVKDGRTNFNGDIYVQSINAYVGGVVGYMSVAKLKKVYSKIKINAENIKINAEENTNINSALGGIAGYANDYEMEKLYEQNSLLGNTQYAGLIVGKVNNNNDEVVDNGKVSYFYSSHSGTFIPKVNISSSNYNNLMKEPEITNNGFDISWNIAIGDDDLTNMDWYLEKSTDQYPYLLFTTQNTKTVMAVEPPSEISISVNTSSSTANQYIRYIQRQVGANTIVLDDTYLIFKGSNNSIKFSDLFNVVVLPDSNILNISKAYSLDSSNEAVVQITGKTQGDYRLKFVSTGVVTITATSKLDADVKKSITLYIVNAVRGFRLDAPKASTIVGNLHELKVITAQNYANNTNYYIKLSHHNYDGIDKNIGIVSINGVLYQNANTKTIDLNNAEKIFVGSKKSGTYIIDYTIFIELVIDEIKYYIDLPNDTGSSLEAVYGSVELTYVYGINSFDVDAKNVETGFNDVAEIMFALTGDDLRLTGDTVSGKGLPYISWTLSETNAKDYWNVELSYANIYYSRESDAIPTVVRFTKNDNNQEDNDDNQVEVIDINDYDINGQSEFNDQIVKIEFVFRVEINSSMAKQFYDNNPNGALTTNMNCKVSILSGDSHDERTTREDVTNFLVKRQKIDKIDIEYYSSAERKMYGTDVVGYSVNETPSDAIIAGQEGLLKIALLPLNAEIKNVKIYYENSAGYNLSMRQSLKNLNKQYDEELETNSQSNDVKNNLYIDRKPYAIAINSSNGTGLELYYKESNYCIYKDINNQEKEMISYDGYLYVTCVIPSSVPTGQIFKITVEALYTNNYLYVQSKDLVSKAQSSIEIAYNFNRVKTTEYSYLANGIEKEFYVDFVDFISSSEVNNIKSIYNPSHVFGNYNDNLADITIDRIENLNFSQSSYRIYYKIKPKNIGKLDLLVSLSKTENNIVSIYNSNSFTFEITPYVITNFSINDGGDNTINIPQNSPKSLGITIDVETNLFTATKTKTAKQVMQEYIADVENTYSTIIEQSSNVAVSDKSSSRLYSYKKILYAMLDGKTSFTGSNDFDLSDVPSDKRASVTNALDSLASITNNYIGLENGFNQLQLALNVLYLEEMIGQNYNYWFGQANGSANYTKLFNSPTAFNNYAVSKVVKDYVTISVKQINTTAILYAELPIMYKSNGNNTGIFDVVDAKNESSKIGDNPIGIVKQNSNGESTTYSQFLRDSVVLNLSSDVSAEYPTPITTAEEFLNMKSGTNGELQYYALNGDIILENYRPISLSGISFDGNGHTISIRNFKPVELSDSDNVFITDYALFSTIDEDSILKNLTVNIEGLVVANDADYRSYVNIGDSDSNILTQFNTVGLDISILNFGAVCVTNNGSIFNVNATSKKLYKQGTYTKNFVIENDKYLEVVSSDNGKKYKVIPNTQNDTYTYEELIGTEIIYEITTVALGQDNTLEFVSDTSNQVNVAGFVTTNAGYITHSKSTINLTTNCGSVAGFAVTNSKKISASKVLFDGTIENTLTTTENSMTAGFVIKNSGSIYSSYISAISNNTESKGLTVKSMTNIGGFAYNSSGTIKDCYTNINVASSVRSGGFVYQNSGTIETSFTNNFVQTKSSAHMPFVATDTTGNYLDDGNIYDCYYIDENYTVIVEHQSIKRIEKDNANQKSCYNKFIFNDTENDYYASIWTLNLGNQFPHLIDADLNFVCNQKYYGLETTSDGTNTYYSWRFDDNPSYGQSNDESINPRTINSIETWNKVLTEETKQDYFVVIKDITATSETPSTAKLGFEGIMLGNNMEIKNLYLRANSTQTNKSFGLFSSISNSSLKNLSIKPKEVTSNNANNVGTLAGYISNSHISCVDIDATDVVVQGRNMVGVFAGIINSSSIKCVDVSGSVNAGFRDSTTELKNFVDDDLKILVNDDVTLTMAETKKSSGTYYYDENFDKNNDELYYSYDEKKFTKIENAKYIIPNHTYFKKSGSSTFQNMNLQVYDSTQTTNPNITLYEVAYIPYSYSGVFAGAVVGTNGSSTITNVNVTGQNKVVGYYAGAVTGLVGINSTLKLCSATIGLSEDANLNYIRAYGIAGGLVGENRGIIERSYIQHSADVQQMIDSNTTNTYVTNRNLNFFVGSPKFIGGLVGFNNGGTIEYSYSKIDVRANNYITKASGGLVGLDVGGTIRYCYATGSVINRFIIGGLVGVVTNKETLLGKTISQTANVVERNDAELIFASNYYYNNNSENKNLFKRSAYVAGKVNGVDDDLGANLLHLSNNLASNKWLLSRDTLTGMTDISMLNNAISGLMIGSIVDHISVCTQNVGENQKGYAGIELNHIFDYKNDSSSFDISDNYVNTQVLKGRVTTTKSSIILSDILRAFVPEDKTEEYYAETDTNGIKQNLLTGIENGSIGGYSEIISLSSLPDGFEIPIIELAKCEINDALVSFENLLNVDDIMLGTEQDLTIGLFKSYNNIGEYFILPNKETSKTRYYPEIIVNINI